MAIWTILGHASPLCRRKDRGASLVEYALLLALIAMVCVAAITVLGTNTGSGLESNTSSLFVR